jgi:diamine N-acetyltransferase
MATVTLREVSADTVRSICRLAVGPEQVGLVAPNAVSIAQAHFEPAAWFRAVYADDEPVGFAMLYDPTRTPSPEDGPDVAYLWRFMIDAGHQRRGYGAAALALVVGHARTLAGVRLLRTSYVDAPGNAAPLYLRAGFRPTGAVEDGEIVLELPLHPA